VLTELGHGFCEVSMGLKPKSTGVGDSPKDDVARHGQADLNGHGLIGKEYRGETCEVQASLRSLQEKAPSAVLR
jgi:hypothetical protein